MSLTHEPPEFEPQNAANPPSAEDDAPADQATPGEDQAAYSEPAPYAETAFSGTEPTLSSEPSPILVSFPGPARQRRWTVAIRIVLAIPHFVVLAILGIALEVVVFISWFAALFAGRLPAWAHTFITGVLRWQTRANAYVFLLTDVYPPFSLDDDAAYPVRLLSRPTRLNRLAVLFRLFLLVPAALLSTVAIYGLLVLSFIGWLTGLFAGKLPEPIHQAVAAVNRYSARYAGYGFMVTSEYPWGFFGDQAAETPADPWRLILSAAAKGTLTACLVVGAGAWGASVAIDSLTFGTAVSNTASLAQIQRANSVLGRTFSSFQSEVAACNQQLTCVTKLDRGAGQALETFGTSVSAAGVPAPAAADASTLANESNLAGRALVQLGSATSVAQYQTILSSSNLQQDLQQVSIDYFKLTRDLRLR
jgi:hypothetical protein